MVRIDARVPVRFGTAEDADTGDAVLFEGEGTPASQLAAQFTVQPGIHAAGCACCLPRSGAALALAELFTRRARGGAEFRSVLAVATSEGGRAAIVDALQSDPVASARFRLA